MDIPLLSYFRADLPQTCFRSVSQSLRHWLCVRSKPVLHSTSLHLLIRQPVLLPAGTLTLPRWLRARALSCWHRKATNPAGTCLRCDSAFCLVSPSLLSPGCRPLAQAMRPLRTELVAALDGAGVLQPPPHRHLLVGLSFQWDTEILILIHDPHRPHPDAGQEPSLPSGPRQVFRAWPPAQGDSTLGTAGAAGPERPTPPTLLHRCVLPPGPAGE